MTLTDKDIEVRFPYNPLLVDAFQAGWTTVTRSLMDRLRKRAAA